MILMAKLAFYETLDIIAESVNDFCNRCKYDDKCYKTCSYLQQMVDNKIKEAEKKKDE